MKNTRTLVIGYGISKSRTEAISNSTINIVKSIKSMGHTVDLFSIDKIGSTESLLGLILKKKEIIQKSIKLIKKNKYTHIIDVFALPLSTITFTLPLIKLFPDIRLVKEIQNDYGYSNSPTIETLIRIFANTQSQLHIAIRASHKLFTRNKYISKKYDIVFLPTLISISKLGEREPRYPLKICYLGHPLKKKGIFVFPKLFSMLTDDMKKQIQFNFAFSKIGPQNKTTNLLKESAKQNSISAAFMGVVSPPDFFRKNDVFILPVHDEYSAASTPTSILESMEAGCVVITTATPSVESFLNNSNSILLDVPTADKIFLAIRRLLQYPESLVEIRMNARTYIKDNHSNRVFIKTLKELYA